MTTNAEAVVPRKRAKTKRHSFWGNLIRRLIREKPLGTFGLIIVIILLLVGIFAPLLAPYGMNTIHLADRLSPPSAKHLLGTDELGRDLLSRLIYGARVSVIIGIVATGLATIISLVIGIVSGFIGGRLDLILQRFVDAFMSIPGLLVLLNVMSIIGKGVPQIILILGITMGIGGSRVIRSAVIGVKSNTYVSAADAIGCGPIRTMIHHITPNIVAPIIISFTLGIGGAIMAEASLSFLGFGVPPGVASWGSMLSNEGRQYMQEAPTLAFLPGFCLTICVYGINMFGDALRDLLDPRLSGGIGRYNLKENKLKKLKEKESLSNRSLKS